MGLQRDVRLNFDCAARAADGDGAEPRVGSLLMLPSPRALERFPYQNAQLDDDDDNDYSYQCW